MAIKVTRNKTTKEMTFSDILKSSRGRAWIILKEINYNKKSEYFMEYLKGLYPKGVTWKKLKEHPEALEFLEKQNFKKPIDIIMFLEG